ncbi:MAG: hypothetical protein IJC85_03680 [Oscillospiraceae bacterium]|nr:hypothetical protein [Oscillospiraceae bacterium]MBQ4101968.1 hypothetical protein [Oscillospiraceae bacterium]
MDKLLNQDGFLTYKGRPLVRQKDTIYFGSMGDPFVAVIQIMAKAEKDGQMLPSKLRVSLMNTDPSLTLPQSIVKNSEKTSLYDALEIADIWLNRA